MSCENGISTAFDCGSWRIANHPKMHPSSVIPDRQLERAQVAAECARKCQHEALPADLERRARLVDLRVGARHQRFQIGLQARLGGKRIQPRQISRASLIEVVQALDRW